MILLLAIAGLWSSSLGKRWRIGLGIAVVAFVVLSLGFREEGGLLWPYRVLYDALPGWNAIRTPGRLATFTSLTLALLAAAGAEAAIRALGRRRWPAWSAIAVAGVLALAIVTEGRSLPFDPFDNQAEPQVPTPAHLDRRHPAPRSSTCRHSPPRRTAPTSSSPRTASPTSSTAEPAPTRPSSWTWSTTWPPSPTPPRSASCRSTGSDRWSCTSG